MNMLLISYWHYHTVGGCFGFMSLWHGGCASKSLLDKEVADMKDKDIINIIIGIIGLVLTAMLVGATLV